MAVVTNSRDPQIWLRKIGISSQIKVVVAGGDISSPKPSPEGYLRGAELLTVEPECCLAIEDSYDGWLAAKNAGMLVALVGRVRPQWLDAETEVMHRLNATNILRRLGE
jgi:HAD superfamily hydrolase (TIGR01509 family)